MSPELPESVPNSLLYGIWGSSTKNIFSVGSSGVILHYDGNDEGIWSPIISGTEESLKAVWGSSGSDIYAVGNSGTILHYDGNAEDIWAPMPSGTTNDLIGIWGSSADDIYVVGGDGIILHYDGNVDGSWITMTTGITNELQGIWGNSVDNVFAVGLSGTILHYNGNTEGIWTSMTSGTGETIANVWGTSHNNIFAVGYTEFGVPGVILRYDGVPEAEDNCPDHYNPDQADADDDGIGDVCDDTNNRICPSEKIYGEYSVETELLRNFRDSVLRTTSEGREIIKLYYELSPMIVKAMEENEEFEKRVKVKIDEILPLIRTEAE